MKVHRKDVKLKEAIKIGDLHTILTKEKEFGLQGMINHGEVPSQELYGGTNGR